MWYFDPKVTHVGDYLLAPLYENSELRTFITDSQISYPFSEPLGLMKINPLEFNN
jgi:hypothetical protein